MIFNKKNIAIWLLIIPLATMAQMTYPQSNGDKVSYNLQIEFRESYISGICILKNNHGIIASSIVNEFGISFIDFLYNEKKDKIKIHEITKRLDHWYIKRTLKRSLKKMMRAMKSGETEYMDIKNKIRYSFTLNNET